MGLFCHNRHNHHSRLANQRNCNYVVTLQKAYDYGYLFDTKQCVERGGGAGGGPGPAPPARAGSGRRGSTGTFGNLYKHMVEHTLSCRKEIIPLSLRRFPLILIIAKMWQHQWRLLLINQSTKRFHISWDTFLSAAITGLTRIKGNVIEDQSESVIQNVWFYSGLCAAIYGRYLGVGDKLFFPPCFI